MEDGSAMLDGLLRWGEQNREWFFSGIGVLFIGLIINLIVYIYKKITKQKSGNNITIHSDNITINMIFDSSTTKSNSGSIFKTYCEDLGDLFKEATKGDDKAQNEIGKRYHEGKGIEKNLKKAFKWWMFAAKQGNAEAAFNVAKCYENGQGIEKNKKKAFQWYKKAAEQGNEKAQLKVKN